ncbi:MAG: aldolase catalytic domain-containing protein [bacterium]|nr:aldolase catalytic domain-containing protein [Candidatus Sumerlaeota bacterium]
MYRPEIKIHDCTIRDGGLINDHDFTDDFVKAVYDTCVKAGVDYMEIGYKASKKLFASDSYGKWKFCDEDAIRRIVGDAPTGTVLSVMADTDRTDYHTDILPREQSVIGCIRVAAYINQMPRALDMIDDAHNKGYETTLNIMAISTVQDRELQDALALAAKSSVDVIYVVDSFGAFYPLKVKELTMTYLRAVEGTGKQVGIHAHNNQQLAYANTIEAVINGANRLDATINGLGRGAGNCPLELLISFLKNPKFRMRPVLQCIEEHFLPLRQKLDWGYSIPYMITGQLNQHPRAAIKARSSDQADNYVAFFDHMMEKE